MRAAIVTAPGTIEIADLPVPVPGPGEALVEVTAAAINPVDRFTARSGIARGLGWDFAGTLADGTAVTGVAVGFGDLGSHAEYVVAQTRFLTPTDIEPLAAATLSLNALAAARTLELATGTSILVTGAAGSVGAYIVELAARQGRAVIAQADDADAAFLRAIGAAEVLGRGQTYPQRVDTVIDAAVIGSLDRVRDGGTYVNMLPNAVPATERGIDVVTVDESGYPDNLAELIAAPLTARVAQTYPLEEIEKAYRHADQAGLRGRIVLVP